MMFKQATTSSPALPFDEVVRRMRRLVHRRLVDSLEDSGCALSGDDQAIRQRIGDLLERLQEETRTPLEAPLRRQIEDELIQELGGMGPLAPLMLDEGVSDILVNGARDIWVDRRGRLEKTAVCFDDEAHLRRFIDRLVAAQGRHLDAGSPMVDARLDDGSRLHAVIPPLCARGTLVSIRRFRNESVTPDELLAQGVLDAPMLALLRLMVSAGMNLVVAGGAAAGKTTLLNILSRFIPHGERVITIEETAELQLTHPHVIPLEARPGNMEGSGSIGLRELVRTALRMRADRIIVGEVRGTEVFDMLQAMNVGHDGSLTTVHANSANDVLRRLEALALQGDMGLPRDAVRDMIGAAIQIVVQLMRFSDGSRRVVGISEVMAGNGMLTTRELYRFEPTPEAVGAPVKIRGRHRQVGEVDSLLARLRLRGFDTHAFEAARQHAGEGEAG